MDFVKKAIWGPDPKEQYRRCQSALRKNKRQIERQLQDLNAVEKKTKTLIRAAVKKDDMKTARMYAREYKNVAKTIQRVTVSKVTLESIGMKLAEQQQMIKLKGSMQKSTEIMKDMNQLVRLPQIGHTVQELSKELTKSGVIDEMMEDMLETTDIYEDEEDEDVDEVLRTILDEKPKTEVQMPEVVRPEEPEPEEVDDELLENMRERLSALQ
ncbi:hypothetical protein KL930_002560 [Ogataea haglerorum]|uniref:Charged multivesicular body protein 3 n=1 Tax=Ogataea haglerorum TaxID=1937702 RepID=A0AAN6I2A4_9ASCO|nr:uncharacterized protein KL911_002138 [Ogataea haglerorum]KAG7696989.1 hypothetical protein KL915_002252 [Ogataea haglerorum]KAG7697321.1 hypothetical protein KL951_002683 [Ogataea haglerorum]KAG7707661.1 hypothetical protein KL914_002482 [Ogataea haglerorum]KAG7709697.1 hypothetical protein KL950_001916 [Ogataea haglerorum]KAG7719776.1 hypothetical protein KL913_001745 [Ogataea haglerorum]